MTPLLIPQYASKEQFYSDVEPLLFYIEREQVWLAHFKTPEFSHVDEIYNISKNTIRNSKANLPNYNIPVEGLSYKIGTCIFSENSKTKGLKKHIHLPKTDLPTVTIGKKIYLGSDDTTFNFYRKNAPLDFTLTDDFVLRFNSSYLPHDVIVPDDNQSIWLFIVLEHCENINLNHIKDFYNCRKIYDYF